MEIRATSLVSMTDIEKSVKELVMENNLRLVGLLAPHQDVRESTAGSATGGEVPEQHQDVSQPLRRRTMGVTIREPSSIPRAAAAPAPLGKGKRKVSEHPEPILQSSDENVMSTEDLFDLYCEPKPVTPLSKKKGSRQHRRESSKNSPTKKVRTGDPPMPVPSKETKPPPAPIDQTSPPAPVNHTHPLAPVNQPPPAPADQTPPDQTGEALTNIVLSSAKDRMTKLSRH
ncbi:pollen-specific leucine-rich repeat extensin-like protein 1 [Humulus lupulus]|uniref:pollen-specific leucine-rich repeat extensin-like protein 1 n=1 Tax=Humulus lupulus TaxID=3486 RepID=UPI002B4064E3|nr:pollen-specific leucine-rich repeat extensin-like protein 1 [Humulus lupulus]